MSLTNPNKLINVQELSYFEGKLAAKYQAQAISITGITAQTVEGALAELATAIASLPSAIVPKGTKTFAQLTPATDLAAGNVGFMWNISDAFTTTADFAEGAGHSIPAGANVYVANIGTAAEPVYKYDIFAGMYDLSGYALKSEMAITDVSGDSTKKNIQLKSGLNQDVIVAHQDISGKADKDTTATENNLAKFDANGNPVDAGIAAGNVATKVASATENNFAGLDANGNLKDSGKKAADFATAAQGTKADSAIQGVKVGSTSLTPDSNKVVTIEVAADTDIDEIFS